MNGIPPLRNGLPMSGMRTNMNGVSDPYGNAYGNSNGYTGNMNGVSAVLNEKSRNPGLEELMRELKEAKVGNQHSSIIRYVSHFHLLLPTVNEQLF